MVTVASSRRRGGNSSPTSPFTSPASSYKDHDGAISPSSIQDQTSKRPGTLCSRCRNRNHPFSRNQSLVHDHAHYKPRCECIADIQRWSDPQRLAFGSKNTATPATTPTTTTAQKRQETGGASPSRHDIHDGGRAQTPKRSFKLANEAASGGDAATAQFSSPLQNDSTRVENPTAPRLQRSAASGLENNNRSRAQVYTSKASFARPKTDSSYQHPARQAVEADAKKYKIPPGFSLKNWDPEGEPILLFGSVFDPNSLGKWIYDWTVYIHGPCSPQGDMAGELWLLLIQLAGKTKRAEGECTRTRSREDRELVEDFIEASERLFDRLRSLLKRCEKQVTKLDNDRDSAVLSTKSVIELINTLLGNEGEAVKTERFMQATRLWNLRFDANCEPCFKKNPASLAVTPKKSTQVASSDSGTESLSDSSSDSDATVRDVLPDDHRFTRGLPGLIATAIQQYELWEADRSQETSSQPRHAETSSGSKSSTQPSKKRRPPKSPEELEAEDDDDQEERRTKRRSLDDGDDDNPSLACPYYKKDCMRYQTCLRFHLKRIKDVKQHLYRKHTQPHFCPSCGEEFALQMDLRQHIRDRNCETRDYAEPEGITDDHRAKFSERVDRKLKVEQQWHAVWDVVFPGVAYPNSVYVKSPVHEGLMAFRQFWSQHGQSLISEQLNHQEVVFDRSNDEGDLTALSNQVLGEVLDRLIHRSSHTVLTGDSSTQEQQLEQEQEQPGLSSQDFGSAPLNSQILGQHGLAQAVQQGEQPVNEPVSSEPVSWLTEAVAADQDFDDWFQADVLPWRLDQATTQA